MVSVGLPPGQPEKPTITLTPSRSASRHGAPEGLGIALRDLRIGRHRVAVATERRHLNIAIFKFLLPGVRFRRIVEQLLHRTMGGIGIAAGSDLHRLHAPAGKLVDHLVGGEIGKRRIEDADRNLAQLAGGSRLVGGSDGASPPSAAAVAARPRRRPTGWWWRENLFGYGS